MRLSRPSDKNRRARSHAKTKQNKRGRRRGKKGLSFTICFLTPVNYCGYTSLLAKTIRKALKESLSLDDVGMVFHEPKGFHWIVEIATYNCGVTQQNMEEALSRVKFIRVESCRRFGPHRDFVSPLPGEATLDPNEFARNRKYYEQSNKKIWHRNAQTRYHINWGDD